METWLIVSLVIGVILCLAVGGLIFYCSKKKHPRHPIAALATFFIPVLGQVGSRFLAVSENKRLKHVWLLIPIFWLPPFTAVPAYFIYNDMEWC